MSVETRIPAYTCPACRHRGMDRTTSAQGDYAPKGGDVTLCIRCGHAMVFNDDLSVREPTNEERRDINADPDVARVRTSIAVIRARRRGLS